MWIRVGCVTLSPRYAKKCDDGDDSEVKRINDDNDEHLVMIVRKAMMVMIVKLNLQYQ